MLIFSLNCNIFVVAVAAQRKGKQTPEASKRVRYNSLPNNNVFYNKAVYSCECKEI